MTYAERADAMAETLRRQLRARGASLSAAASYAGRRLPKRYRGDVQALVDAARCEGHPKLRRMIDEARVARAERRLHGWLGTRDPKRERMGSALDRLAGVAFILCLVGLGYFFWVLWTGTA